METLLHVWFKHGLLFCFFKTKLCCVCFWPLPFVCWWLEYYLFGDIIFCFCFSAICWFGYFLFGWGCCMYCLSSSTNSIIVFMVFWHWLKCYCMCHLSLCCYSILCKHKFLGFVFVGFRLFVEVYIAFSWFWIYYIFHLELAGLCNFMARIPDKIKSIDGSKETLKLAVRITDLLFLILLPLLWSPFVYNIDIDIDFGWL